MCVSKYASVCEIESVGMRAKERERICMCGWVTDGDSVRMCACSCIWVYISRNNYGITYTITILIMLY